MPIEAQATIHAQAQQQITKPTTALAKAEPGKLTLEFRDFGDAGPENYAILVPENEYWQDIVIRAAFLKKGPMARESFATCVCVVRYADAMGLNEVLGDLYIVNNKIATTADAKIRHAMGSGLIAGYTVDMTKGALIGLDYTIRDRKATHTTHDLHCKVTVRVKGWDTPVVYEADLVEWFNGSNATWREHTAYMFRKNCLSKALAEVAPLGIDAEEIPVAPPPPQLEKALEEIKAAKSVTGRD